MYYDVRNVTLASDDRSVLVSYENRVGRFSVILELRDLISRILSPSQFWQLQVDKHDTSADFVLRHSYIPKENVSFAALPSIFGGEHDHLVLRAATGE